MGSTPDTSHWSHMHGFRSDEHGVVIVGREAAIHTCRYCAVRHNIQCLLRILMGSDSVVWDQCEFFFLKHDSSICMLIIQRIRLYPPEILPLSVRAKGASLSTATNWLFNFIVGETTPALQHSIGWRLYIMHGLWCMVSFVVGTINNVSFKIYVFCFSVYQSCCISWFAQSWF